MEINKLITLNTNELNGNKTENTTQTKFSNRKLKHLPATTASKMTGSILQSNWGYNGG